MKKLVLSMLLSLTMMVATKAATVIIQTDITTNTTWTNNNLYVLKGFIYVTGGSTLTIEPGTVIMGDQVTKGSLIITRGCKIIADGTPTQPIVFTSPFGPGNRSYGDWGGLIVLGNAKVNDPSGQKLIEGGVDAVKGLYGGNDPADNSGIIRYVRIEFGGIAFVANSEINGLTCGAVGSGTTIDHVQVSYSGDDSYEWFGGSVNCKYLIAHRGWDDDFDTDNSFNGHLQFGVAVRDSLIADQSGSNGFESDNEGTSPYTNGPITRPIFSNFSVFGPKQTATGFAASNFKRALHLRRNTKTSTYNSVFTGFPIGLKIEQDLTANNAINGELDFKNNIIAGCTQPLDSTAITVALNMTNWFNANNNSILANTSDVMSPGVSNYTNPNFIPTAGSPLLSGADFSDADLNDASITPVTYRGAFGTTDWTKCWSEFNPQYADYTGAVNYAVATPVITYSGSNTICDGESITLTAPTAASYLWSNGETTQSITVNTTGNYSVTVSSSRGCTASSAPVAVTVNPVPTPIAAASGATTFCAGGSVTLTATGGNTYLWTPGGETTASITVNASGSYVCTATNSNGCSATTTPIVVTVNALPTASISAGGPTTFCQGGNVSLSSVAGSSYLWLPGGETTQTINVNSSGSYACVLTNADGCSATSSIINVTANPLPTASVSANGPTSFCTGNNVVLTASAGSAFLWSPGGQTSQSITVTASGSYNCTVTNANGCSATSSNTVVSAGASPSPTIQTSGSTAICQGSNVTLTASNSDSYLWSPGGQTTQSITVSTAGSYTVTTTNADACNGTGASAATVVTVNALPTATITPNGATTFCEGGNVVLASSTGSSYLWSPGGATTASISVDASGSYTCTVTNSNGCTATSTPATVTVNALPTATVTANGPTTFCQGENVILTSSAGSTYLWTPGNQTTPSITVNSNGVFSCTVTNSNGCSATSTQIAVNVNQLPTAAFSIIGNLPDITFINNSTGSSTYSWNFGDGSAASTATSPTHTYSVNGQYDVILTATSAEGCEDTTMMTVNINTGIGSVKAPETVVSMNAFPNPLNNAATIQISANRNMEAQVYLIDMTGKVVMNLWNGNLAIGMNNITLDASNLGGGIYFARMVSSEMNKTTKLVIIK